MMAYRRHATIDSSGQLVLSDLPFEAGQRVEILVLAEGGPQSTRREELRALFRATQSLPEAQSITEEEIVAEIAAYRKELE